MLFPDLNHVVGVLFPPLWVVLISPHQSKWFKRRCEYFSSTHHSGWAIFALWWQESKLSSFSGNQRRKENHRSARKCEKMPLCCTAAALSRVLSSSLAQFLYPVHENTSIPPHFLDSKINNKKTTTAFHLCELTVEINIILLLNCNIVQFSISLQKNRLIVLPSAVPVKVWKCPTVMSS